MERFSARRKEVQRLARNRHDVDDADAGQAVGIYRCERFEMEYKITAKGYPYAVISREPNEKTGQVTELHIILNEQHERLSNREYVLQKHRFAADGAESASAEIVDFYLVDCATLEVTDEHTTQWHKANRS